MSNDLDDIASAYAKLRYDLASVKMNLLARRYDIEVKYSPTQPRVPAGQHTGGQWTKGPGVAKFAAARVAASIGARLAIGAGMETAPAAGTALLPALVGGIGISRAAGLYAVGTGAATGMTPFLGLPFSMRMGPVPGSPIQFQRQNNLYRECDAQLDDDLTACRKLAPQGRKSGYPENQSYAICERQAIQRYSECIAGGGLSAIRSPLFTLGKGHR